MRLVLVSLIAVFIPYLGWAAETADLELVPMGLKVMASLALVLGLVLLIYALLRRGGRWIPSAQNSAIKLVEVRHLAPKKTLYLVEVKGSTLLLGATAEHMETLAQWPSGADDSFSAALKEQMTSEEQ